MKSNNQMTTEGWSRNLLTYCSNVHPGESLDEVLSNITHFNQSVCQQRGLSDMTSGLWLSAKTAADLQGSIQLKKFKDTLASAELSLTSINGFPFGDFHKNQVKESVYLPDWSERSRLDYTKNLANILAACLPGDITQGAISTLPLGYKQQWNIKKQTAADKHIKEILLHLEQLFRNTGKLILLCIEMEPDCVLESTKELINYFQQNVQPVMQHTRYLGVCYDVCHQAVMHEDIELSLADITAANITIGKIQLSNALEVNLNTPDTKQTLSYLHEFSEPKYLHQVKTIDQDQRLHSSPDLALALQGLKNNSMPQLNPWRIHFHVPLHADTLLDSSLTTTKHALLKVFDFLQKNKNIRPYLEVETYSWQVLPESLRPENDEQLTQGIVCELNWVEAELNKRNLLINSSQQDAE